MALNQVKKIPKEIDIEWGAKEWKEIANEKFLPLVNDNSRIIILYGSRGSSKSYFVAQKIIYKMLSEPYFKGLLVRQVQDSIRETSFQMLLEVISSLKLDSLFTYTLSPLAITCSNGNKLLAKGLDKPGSTKSIPDLTFIHWEEEIPSEDAWTIISTSLRTKKSTYIQEIFSLNPEIEGGYEDNWFFKRFFSKKYPAELDFKTKIEIKGLNNKIIEQSVTVHHSTYLDNRFLTEEYKAGLEALKNTNAYWYDVYALGLFGHKENKQAFYKEFSRANNVFSGINYEKEYPIYLSVDFNAIPGMHALILQVKGNVAYVVDEIVTKTPNNNTPGLCREFIKRYREHQDMIYLVGDASGYAKSTKLEEGQSDYSLIMGALKNFNIQNRASHTNPSVTMRGVFINEIFAGRKEIKIKISDKCKVLINDLVYGKEAQDGTKLKQKVTENKITFELYHHMDDAMDYAIVEIFKQEFSKAKRGGKGGLNDYILGKKPFNQTHNY